MQRRRYFKDPSKPVFDWLGVPLSPPKADPEDRKLAPKPHIYFGSFSLGSLLVTAGDFVLVTDKDNILSLNECDVVRVDQLYHDYDNKTAPHRAVVTWFCRPDFLSPALRAAGHGLEEQGAPPLDPEHEVVGEVRNYETDIRAESIHSKCSVVQGGLGEVPEEFAKAKKEGQFPCYLHRLDMQIGKDMKTGKKLYRMEPLFGRDAGAQACDNGGDNFNDIADSISICWFCHADLSNLENNKCLGCRKVTQPCHLCG